MPDLGPNKRAVRRRPVIVVTRGYDPTQPNKTSFLAPPKTYVSTDADFIWSGMAVRQDTDGKLIPAQFSDLDDNVISRDQVGFAFQDSNRFDVVNSRQASAISSRSDVEIRTGWFDRSVAYKVGDPLTLGTTPGELTLATGLYAGAPIVGRVSVAPRFEGGNPRIGNVNYNYVSQLPALPVGTPDSTAKGEFNASINAWITANGLVNPVEGGFDETSPANDGAAGYNAAVAYRNAQVNLRQSASDVSSLQATDNSVITFVTARI